MGTTDSSERKLVLEMLADGKISAEDAERLLDKLQEIESRRREGGGDTRQTPRPRHLRIVASGEGAEDELNLRIPIGLVRAGLTLESFLPTWAQSRIIVGSSFSDLQSLDKDYLRENLDELDLTFDSKSGESVRIFAE
ncbi:MAG: hypothetical protein GY719_22470 [bacterium]|nr:hypothetical protein [bacterium]